MIEDPPGYGCALSQNEAQDDDPLDDQEQNNPFRQSSGHFLPSEEGTMSRNHADNR